MKKILIQYTWIIGIIILLFLVTSCANKPVQKTNNPNVYDGSLGILLGCIFDPSDCKDHKESKDRDDIGWEEVDKSNK